MNANIFFLIHFFFLAFYLGELLDHPNDALKIDEFEAAHLPSQQKLQRVSWVYNYK
jgi:hypothetical protein